MSKEKLYIFDTTLRDGAQTQGVDFSVEDKEKIAFALDSLGVDYIEGGWPGANPTDTEFFQKNHKFKNAKLTSFGMTKRSGRSAENDTGLSALLNKFDVEANNSKVDAVKFAELLTYLKEEKISGQATKKVLENIWENPDLSVSKSIQDLGLEQISDDNEIEEIIEKVIKNNPDQKEQFLSGKDRLFGFFVGQVMKESKGKANPKLVNEILKKKLV